MLPLTNFVHTPAEATTLSNAATALLSRLYHSDFIFAKEASPTLAQLAAEQAVDTTNPTTTTKFLQELLISVTDLPQVTVTTAFPASPRFQKQLTDWFSQQPRPVLVNLAHDPGIVGGVTVHKDGRFYDYSVATRLKNHVF